MNFTKQNILYIVLALLIIATVVYIATTVLQKDSSNREVPIIGNYDISNEEASLTFSYPASVTGLTLVEPVIEEGGMLKDAYVLTPTPAYIAYQSSTTESGTSAPPSISLLVFDLPPKTVEEESRDERLLRWANQNKAITAFVEGSESQVVEMDGLEMYHYSAPGLYNRDVYLGTYSGNIYMFIGQYTDETDSIREQFTALLKTIKFD